MDTQQNYQWLHAEGTTPIKGWVNGVPLEAQAHEQLRNIAAIPFVGPWVAVMPDVHLGKGATVGSVIPTRGAIIPAAVGVDIGCGMAAVRTTLRADDLPDDLRQLRNSIERSRPSALTLTGLAGSTRMLDERGPRSIARDGSRLRGSALSAIAPSADATFASVLDFESAESTCFNAGSETIAASGLKALT